jgi:DNA polymerase-3 subunit epsilon
MTEVAIYKFDGEKIVDEFHSLVNPECSIPSFVIGLTGITNEMASKAPKFFEIAKDIVRITEGTCFVAHNVNFDYSFFQMEFESLGYEFKSNRLCTLELSKLLLPGHDSYSLGKLCKSLGIQLKNRHRADGDALATVELFRMIMNADKDNVLAKKLRRS